MLKSQALKFQKKRPCKETAAGPIPKKIKSALDLSKKIDSVAAVPEKIDAATTIPAATTLTQLPIKDSAIEKQKANWKMFFQAQKQCKVEKKSVR